METPNAHLNAARLKSLLLALLAAALGWSMYALYLSSQDLWRPLAGAFVDDRSAERPELWSALGEIDGADWLAMLVWLLLIPVLGKCLLVMLKAPWGKDFTWSDGRWTDTDPMGLHAGAGLPLAAPLKESLASLKAGLVVMTAISIFVFVGAVGSIDSLFEEQNEAALAWPLSLLPLCAALLFLSVVAYAGANVLTRRVQFDDVGICDSNFFRAQRIAWSSVAQCRLTDIGDSLPNDSQGSSRGSHPAWVLKDAQGRTLLTLDPGMAPQASLDALRQRADSLLGAGAGSGAGQFGFLDIAPPEPVLDHAAQDASELRTDDSHQARQAALRQAMLEHVTRFKSLERGFNRTALISMSLVLVLFLAPALITTYQALWFQFAAARIEGVVVEIPEDSLPSLVVEFKVPGQPPLRANSDGSDAYADYRVGDRVGVFYDPEQPEDARLDLFLELWLGPIVMGSLALIMGLIMALIARSFRPPRTA
jgi:hypothetical protein